MWAQIERGIAVMLLAAIVLLVLLAALLRTAGYPIIWSVDIAQLLFAWLSVIAANQALRQGSHARLDILMNRLRLINRLRLTLALNLISMSCMLVVAVFGFQLVGINPARTLGSTAIPYAWVTAALPAGAVLMLVTLLQQSVRVFHCLRKPGDALQNPPAFLASVLTPDTHPINKAAKESPS